MNRLHIQAVRGQLSIQGEILTRCACCGSSIQERREKAVPGMRTCMAYPRVRDIRGKNIVGESSGKVMAATPRQGAEQLKGVFTVRVSSARSFRQMSD